MKLYGAYVFHNSDSVKREYQKIKKQIITSKKQIMKKIILSAVIMLAAFMSSVYTKT